jgi:hypothetical protein
MPCNECPVDKKSRKSHKKSDSHCDTSCCAPEEPLDCCTIPYQRLEKLRDGWAFCASTGNRAQNNMGINVTLSASGDVTTAWNRLNEVCTRDGNEAPVPVGGNVVASSVSYDVPSIWTQGEGPAVVNAISLTDVTVSGLSTTTTLSHANIGDDNLSNFMYAYDFVNSVRYLPFEECGKQDQVVGWYVNLQTGQLQLFQDLCELNLLRGNTRGQYISIPIANLSPIDKARLKSLNQFYKLSKRAVEKVGSNLKEEGNIVEVTDKCGQRWLVAVNRLHYCASVCDYNCEYVLVAIRLC